MTKFEIKTWAMKLALFTVINILLWMITAREFSFILGVIIGFVSYCAMEGCFFHALIDDFDRKMKEGDFE